MVEFLNVYRFNQLKNVVSRDRDGNLELWASDRKLMAFHILKGSLIWLYFFFILVRHGYNSTLQKIRSLCLSKRPSERKML